MELGIDSKSINNAPAAERLGNIVDIVSGPEGVRVGDYEWGQS